MINEIDGEIGSIEKPSMSREEWFRRTTWTQRDRDEFDARLKRSRGSGNKAQYLRIQAMHLAEADHHEAAIQLLDRLFDEFPVRIQLAQAHCQKANSLATLGHVDAALDEFRRALQTEREFPNVRTQAWLDFGWLAIDRQLSHLYDEVLRVLHEFREDAGLTFPRSEYRYFAIQALISDHHNEHERARGFATFALAEAAKDHSGLRYHPTVGLVGSERSRFESRLKALANA